MRLKALQRQWDAWGRSDPLWSAVTHNAKLGRRWDVDEFMRTGRDEIDLVLRHLGDLGVEVQRRRALDFGCGVGRYTQPLAEGFERADGVDIAPSMLEEAQRLNRHPGRCHYHLNARDDLALFADGSFTFVYSMLVLQHVRPESAKCYLGEFLRVLAPGGALVFQLPAAAAQERAAVTLSAGTGPLAADAFRAGIETPVKALSVTAGELFPMAAHVRNESAHTWPSLGGPDGRFHVQFANRWLRADGSVYARDDERSALPFDVRPGEGVPCELWLVPPPERGDYLLELDLVQEGVAWFGERGSPTVRIPCTVEGGTRPAVARGATRRREPLLAGFRLRHPRLHGALRRLGVVPLYRASVARARRLREHWRRWRRPRLVMEMHTVPSAEVARIIEAGGGRLLETETERWPDGILSARYWVVKPLSGSPGSAV